MGASSSKGKDGQRKSPTRRSVRSLPPKSAKRRTMRFTEKTESATLLRQDSRKSTPSRPSAAGATRDQRVSGAVRRENVRQAARRVTETASRLRHQGDPDDDIPPPPPPPVEGEVYATAIPRTSLAPNRKSMAASLAPAARYSGRKSPIPNAARLSKTGRALSDSTLVAAAGSSLGSNRVDPTFVNYTVVPLLLRSGLAYEKAQNLGERFKTYTRAELDAVLASPEALIAALVNEQVNAPLTFAARLRTDRFWEESSKADKRKSYVYFRSDPEARKSVGRVRHKSTSASAEPKRRSEFASSLVPGQRELSRSDLDRLSQHSKDSRTLRAFYDAK